MDLRRTFRNTTVNFSRAEAKALRIYAWRAGYATVSTYLHAVLRDRARPPEIEVPKRATALPKPHKTPGVNLSLAYFHEANNRKRECLGLLGSEFPRLAWDVQGLSEQELIEYALAVDGYSTANLVIALSAGVQLSTVRMLLEHEFGCMIFECHA